MDNKVKELAVDRGITRLCHFTQARNLAHIFGSSIGLCSSLELSQSSMPYNPNDILRYDQHKELICCSVEYPNVFYFRAAISKEKLFKDWAVLFIKPDYIWSDDTKFCPCNAAKSKGAYIGEGATCFQSLFDFTAKGSGILRCMLQLRSTPTDNQAEVLIKGPVPTSDIVGVVFSSKEQAQCEHARLKLLQIPISFKSYIAPDFFDRDMLISKINFDMQPELTVFEG